VVARLQDGIRHRTGPGYVEQRALVGGRTKVGSFSLACRSL